MPPKGQTLEKKPLSPSEQEFYRKLGIALRKTRKNLGLTQMKVAAVINVTFQQIQKYEKGNTRPSEFKSRQIVNFFGQNYEQFIKENDVYTSTTENRPDHTGY